MEFGKIKSLNAVYLCSSMVYTAVMHRGLAQSTLMYRSVDVTTPTKCWLNIDLNLNLVPKRTVSEDLFHVKNRKIFLLQEHVLFGLLDKIKLHKARFQVTGFVNFRQYISAYAYFDIHWQKLLAQTFNINFKDYVFNHMDTNYTCHKLYECNFQDQHLNVLKDIKCFTGMLEVLQDKKLLHASSFEKSPKLHTKNPSSTPNLDQLSRKKLAFWVWLGRSFPHSLKEDVDEATIDKIKRESYFNWKPGASAKANPRWVIHN